METGISSRDFEVVGTYKDQYRVLLSRMLRMYWSVENALGTRSIAKPVPGVKRGREVENAEHPKVQRDVHLLSSIDSSLECEIDFYDLFQQNDLKFCTFYLNL